MTPTSVVLICLFDFCIILSIHLCSIYQYIWSGSPLGEMKRVKQIHVFGLNERLSLVHLLVQDQVVRISEHHSQVPKMFIWVDSDPYEPSNSSHDISRVCHVSTWRRCCEWSPRVMRCKWSMSSILTSILKYKRFLEEIQWLRMWIYRSGLLRFPWLEKPATFGQNELVQFCDWEDSYWRWKIKMTDGRFGLLDDDQVLQSDLVWTQKWPLKRAWKRDREFWGIISGRFEEAGRFGRFLWGKCRYR